MDCSDSSEVQEPLATVNDPVPIGLVVAHEYRRRWRILSSGLKIDVGAPKPGDDVNAGPSKKRTCRSHPSMPDVGEDREYHGQDVEPMELDSSIQGNHDLDE